MMAIKVDLVEVPIDDGIRRHFEPGDIHIILDSCKEVVFSYPEWLRVGERVIEILTHYENTRRS